MKNFCIIAIAIIAIGIIGCGGGNDEPPPPETFTVTFNANGGSPTPEPQPVEKGKTATEPQGVTKANNTLDGWYKEEALTTKWNFANGNGVAADTVTADITLWAKWVLAETAFRDYNDQVMFSYNDTDYFADIKDARTGARDKNLEELGIVKQLKDNFVASFATASAISNSERRKYTNVFDPEVNPKGKVKITIENNVNYESYEVDDSANVRFSIDYLTSTSVSNEDLQASITIAVEKMRDAIVTP